MAQDDINTSGQYLYDAFISYRHKDLDIAVAKKLHGLLENYRIPVSIRKQTGIRKIRRVFRDQEELPTSCNLSNDIQHALMHSKYLIVICSKDTPSSKWCAEEIESFRQTHGNERILSLLIDGEPDEAFPKELRYHKVRMNTADGGSFEEEKQIEPLAADIRGTNLKEMFQKLKVEKLRLLAPILGVGFDNLRQRHREQFIKKTIAFVLAISLVLAVFGSYSLYQLSVISSKNRELAEQKNLAEQNEALAIEQKNNVLKNQSLYLSDLSGEQLRNGDRYNALLLALEALPEDPDHPDRPYVPEAEVALRNAVTGYGIGKYTSNMTFQTELRIASMSFSHNGKFMVTCSDPRTDYPILWDTESGEKIALLNSRADSCSVRFNADDSQVMLLWDIGLVSVWDTATRKVIYSHFDLFNQTQSAEYTPDGKKIITGTENGISTWDARSGTLLSEFRTDSAFNLIKISADGTLLAMITDDITIRDMRTGNDIKLQNAKGSTKTSVEFSPDGTKLLVYSKDESLPGIWDTATGTKLMAPDYITSAHVTSSDISNSGLKVVTGYDDGMSVIWEMSSGKVSVQYNKEFSFTTIYNVISVMFSPDDNVIISSVASFDSTATVLWNAHNGENIDKIDGLSPALAPNGYIATANENAVKMWTTGKVEEYDSNYADRRICFNNDGSQIASALWESNIVNVQDSLSGKVMLQLSGHIKPILEIVYSPDDSMIAATGKDGQTIVWDTETGDKLMTLQCGTDEDYVWSARFNADGTRLATTGGYSVVIWNMMNGKEELRISDEKDYKDAEFSQDGSKLLVATFDAGGYVLNSISGQREAAIGEQDSHLSELRYNKDSSRIIAISYGAAELWNANTYQLMSSLNSEEGDINSVQFNKDGTKLVTTSNTNKVIVWDAVSGNMEKQIGNFGRKTTYAEFSPDGSKLLVASQGISVWDLNLDMELTHIGTEGFVYQNITFSPDNNSIFSSSPFLVSWRLDSLSEIMKTAESILQGRTLSDSAKTEFYID